MLNNQSSDLRQAAVAGDSDITQVLATHCAEVNSKNRWNLSILDYAQKMESEEIVELLKKHGVKE